MDSGLRVSVGTRIRDLLRDAGITQDQVAAALGIQQSQVSRRLAGRLALDIDELAAIAALIGCTPADLLADPAPAHPGT